MTKQEWIREGIGEIIRDAGIRRFQEEKPYAMHALLVDCADSILTYLHSQGVVIKVNKGMPCVEEDNPFIRLDEQAKILDAGFVAVENLIKD